MVGVRITVGRFTLSIGADDGTRVDPAPEPEHAARRRLARARRDASRTGRAAEALEGAGAELESTIAAVERADELVSLLVRGLTLDPKVLEQQVARLLDLVDRADREGRLDDELRLARALVALLALIPRWLALVEILERLSATAAAAGDALAEGWAEHELGSLALAADDARAATHHLEAASRLREQAGDVSAAALTRHNLALVPLAEAGASRDRTRLRRRRIALAVGVTAALVAVGIGAVATRADDPAETDESVPTVTDETPTDTSEGTGTDTTDAGDTEPPTVVVTVPAAAVAGTIVVAADAQDADSGVNRVRFSVARPDAGSAVELGEVEEAPYRVEWDTTAVPDGAYRVVAAATDGVGNEGEAAPVPVLVDNAAPAVTLGAPDATAAGYALAAKAEDGSGSGVASVRFEHARPSDDDAGGADATWTRLAVVEIPSEGVLYETTLDTSGFGGGDLLLRAVAIDRVGNAGVSNVARVTIPVE